MKRNDFRILIAEDEPGVRKIYERAFKAEGYEVVLAESGNRMLAELSEGSFDMLITDLKLTETSALETLPEIRKRYPTLPVVVVSGYYVNMVEDFAEKGFKVDMFFNKPLSLAVLVKAVGQILGVETALNPKG